MNDVDCNSILSCDCIDDEDSSERLIRLSTKDKLKSDICVPEFLFFIICRQ